MKPFKITLPLLFLVLSSAQALAGSAGSQAAPSERAFGVVAEAVSASSGLVSWGGLAAIIGVASVFLFPVIVIRFFPGAIKNMTPLSVPAQP